MTREILLRLLAATDEPPELDDPMTLLDAFMTTMTARQAILDELGIGLALTTDEERALAAEVFARQDAWQGALARARDRLGRARTGLGQMRRYAPSPP